MKKACVDKPRAASDTTWRTVINYSRPGHLKPCNSSCSVGWRTLSWRFQTFYTREAFSVDDWSCLLKPQCRGEGLDHGLGESVTGVVGSEGGSCGSCLDVDGERWRWTCRWNVPRRLVSLFSDKTSDLVVKYLLVRLKLRQTSSAHSTWLSIQIVVCLPVWTFNWNQEWVRIFFFTLNDSLSHFLRH